MAQRFYFDLRYQGQLFGNPGYAFYGMLMEHLPPELGEELHQQDRFLLRQSVRYWQREGRASWTVDLFDPRLEPILTALAAEPSLTVQKLTFQVQATTYAPLPQPAELFSLAAERFGEADRCRIELLTPCTFRQQGRYVIFPTVELMVQSLAARWDLLHPDTPIRDPDAGRELCRGLAIEDYRLHTTRGQLKGVRIPAFCGSVILRQRLPAPLRQLWQVLLLSGEQTGMGAKTALGMGAITAAPVPSRCDGEANRPRQGASHLA